MRQAIDVAKTSPLAKWWKAGIYTFNRRITYPERRSTGCVSEVLSRSVGVRYGKHRYHSLPAVSHVPSGRRAVGNLPRSRVAGRLALLQHQPHEQGREPVGCGIRGILHQPGSCLLPLLAGIPTDREPPRRRDPVTFIGENGWPTNGKSPSSRRGALALLILTAVALVLFVDVNAHKPWLEAAASDAWGWKSASAAD